MPFPIKRILLACLLVLSLGAVQIVSAQNATHTALDPLKRSDYLILDDMEAEAEVTSYLGVVYTSRLGGSDPLNVMQPMIKGAFVRVGKFNINFSGVITGLALSAGSAWAIREAVGQRRKTVSEPNNLSIPGVPIPIPIGSTSKQVNDGYRVPLGLTLIPGLCIGFAINNQIMGTPSRKAKKIVNQHVLNLHNADLLLYPKYQATHQKNLLMNRSLVKIKTKAIRLVPDIKAPDNSLRPASK